MVKWTREQIIREILRREVAGLSLTAGKKAGVDSTLYQAAAREAWDWLASQPFLKWVWTAIGQSRLCLQV